MGNLRTALFSWALARALGGDFILRIEDTDPARNTPEATQLMLEGLTWLGLDWDEGPDMGGEYAPYVQSERIAFHQDAVAQLLAGDHAYYGDDPARSAPAQGNPLRLRMPRSGQTVVRDAIRGEVVFDNSQYEDPVLVRSDGRPLYHLAAMVDDHDMAISHVVRGEEWLSSAPIHIQIYRALGWSEPVWVHLPLVLNERREKLKKRDPEGGYLITDFQEAGYLPAALFNYLLLLGWSPDGEQEIVSKWDVRQQFRLERLSATPAIFDWDKLKWVNRQYMQRLSDEAVAELIKPFLEDAYDRLPPSPAWLVRLATVVRPALDKAEDVIEAAEWAFEDEVALTGEARELLQNEAAHAVLAQLVAEVAAVVVLDEQTAETILAGVRRRFEKEQGLSAGKVFRPIRAALMGTPNGPPLAEIMGIIGKQRTLLRAARALGAAS